MNARRLTISFKYRQEINWDPVLSGELLTVYLDGDILAHFRNPWGYVSFVSVIFLHETIRAVVSCLLIPLIGLYQNFEAVFGIAWSVPQLGWRAIVLVATMTTSSFHLTTAIILADIRLIWEGAVTVRLPTRHTIIGCIHWALREPSESISCCGSLSSNLFSWPITDLSTTIRYRFNSAFSMGCLSTSLFTNFSTGNTTCGRSVVLFSSSLQ